MVSTRADRWALFRLNEKEGLKLTSVTHNTGALTPLEAWRADWTHGFVLTTATGLVIGLLLGLLFLIFGGLEAWLPRGLLGGLTLVLATGLVFGLILGPIYPGTWYASLAFVQLARRGHTPLRLMRFLEDAR
jgi:hypothetical protein